MKTRNSEKIAQGFDNESFAQHNNWWQKHDEKMQKTLKNTESVFLS